MNSAVAEHFGTNLARARMRAGISQEELSFRASLHRTEIGMVERGVRLPRIDTLAKLTGALGATPNDLMEGIEWTGGQVSAGAFRIGAEDHAEDGR